MRRRVVITGIGIYSCLGKSLDEVASSLYRGKSGIGVDPARVAYGYRSPLTGIVTPPDLKGWIDRRMRQSLPEEAEFAVASTHEAMLTAGIDEDYRLNHEIGIFYGNDTSAQAVIETHEVMREKGDSMLIGSGGAFKSMTSAVSMNLSTIFKLRGVSISVAAACASGSHAIGLGYIFIRSGMQDMVLCGGAQEVNVYSMAGFDGLSAFSMRIDEPEKASRPFDANRDGLTPSGGAASLILEDEEHALKRGATIYGEVVGYGFSSNGGQISQADEQGAAITMTRALADAGIKSSDVDYINAHATSTPQGDRCEALAIDRIFAALGTPVSSTKSMTGHECWMAGASEIVYSLLMMKNSFIAPNINFETPDETAKNLNIISETKERNIDLFLSNSFGFGGTNSSIVVKKYRKRGD
ncbi:MAG: beta-ketoacyl-[acyl-carrier-protein] synthase family protein [Tannerella sp.]|jgi:3-oxoacyl-[acyl-carrier-protein] synthase-1|nr:beta-ketoacyl-[acyl-carrier-protein] synthase family protein [Tannerella sp.]